jgi:adenosylcobinamide-GDP ribazoletransferase
VKALSLACAFLTRLPVRTGELRPEQFGSAAACFPLIGLGLGMGNLAIASLSIEAIGPALSACLIVAFGALVTGGLHLDGLADWFDAIGGGRGDPSRMLEIMRDSRIGAHGASALGLLLTTKIIALSELRASALHMGLVCAPTCSRAVAVWLLFAFPSARKDGLGQTFSEQVVLRHALIASAIALLVSLLFGPAVLVPIGLSAATGFLIAGWAKARIGGISGDVCGAAIELAELAFLIGARAL